MTHYREVMLYIHGMDDTLDPERHTRVYDALEKRIKAHLGENRHLYPEKENRIDIEWGYNNPDISTGDRHLAEAQKRIWTASLHARDSYGNSGFSPVHLVHNQMHRHFFLGLADMMYYISEDGKKQVRANVLSQILQCLKADEAISLNILAHSAGTLIICDLLYILFGGGENHYLTDEKDRQLLKKCQQAIADKQLRLLNLFTFGSPLAPMMVRNQKLIEKLVNSELLDLHQIGLLKTAGYSGSWLNFWNKEDSISSPLAFLYDDPHHLIQDIYTEPVDTFPGAHDAYWMSSSMAEKIAQKLTASWHIHNTAKVSADF